MEEEAKEPRGAPSVVEVVGVEVAGAGGAPRIPTTVRFVPPTHRLIE